MESFFKKIDCKISQKEDELLAFRAMPFFLENKEDQGDNNMFLELVFNGLIGEFEEQVETLLTDKKKLFKEKINSYRGKTSVSTIRIMLKKESIDDEVLELLIKNIKKFVTKDFFDFGDCVNQMLLKDYSTAYFMISAHYLDGKTFEIYFD